MPLTTDTLRVTGEFRHAANITPKIVSTLLAQRDLQEYVLDFTSFRVHDAFQTNLPGTPLTDDLGLVGGTFGTSAPSIQTEDLMAADLTTSYARFMVGLPAEYVAGETVYLRFAAGMLTTAADTSCTLDVECYKFDEDSTSTGDLCTTVAASINSTDFADKDFTINPATLSPGDVLDVRITIACNDAASETAVTACVAAAKLVCDTQG